MSFRDVAERSCSKTNLCRDCGYTELYKGGVCSHKRRLWIYWIPRPNANYVGKWRWSSSFGSGSNAKKLVSDNDDSSASDEDSVVEHKCTTVSVIVIIFSYIVFLELNAESPLCTRKIAKWKTFDKGFINWSHIWGLLYTWGIASYLCIELKKRIASWQSLALYFLKYQGTLLSCYWAIHVAASVPALCFF